MNGNVPRPIAVDSHQRASSAAMLSHVYWTSQELKLWLVLIVSGTALVYANRMTMSLAVVPIETELEWDKRTSGVVLSSFYWGYLLTQVVGGYAADRFGGDLVQWTAALLWSLCTLLIPLAVEISTILVILLRFLCGLSQGVHFPAVISLVVQRVPLEYRSIFFGFVFSGTELGIVLAGFVGGLISWQYYFLLFGTLGVGWALTVKYLASTKKTQYKLSDSGTSQQRGKLNAKVTLSGNSLSDVPWKRILKKPPVLALFAVQFSHGFFIFTLMSWLPSYFHDTFPNRSDKQWVHNTLPWMAVCVSGVLGGCLSHKLLAEGWSTTFVRKLIEIIDFFGSSVFLLLMAVVDQSAGNFNFVVVCLSLCFFCYGFKTTGSAVNATDLLPSYVGAMWGMTNSFSIIPGIFGVSFVGYVLYATSSWPVVFCIIASSNLLGLAVYVAWGSGKHLDLS